MPAKPCQVKNVMLTGYSIVTSRLIKRKSQRFNNTTDKSLNRATDPEFPLTCVTGAIHHRIRQRLPRKAERADSCTTYARGTLTERLTSRPCRFRAFQEAGFRQAYVRKERYYPGFLMRKCASAALMILFLLGTAGAACATAGISPEQIYQPSIAAESVVGTWELLPDDNPLGEKPAQKKGGAIRIIMTLRKDGTCRLFDRNHPAGTDGLWNIENHTMVIRLPSGSNVGFFVYGVRGDYMVTRSPIKGGIDQLWARVK